jgi:hypothetical protein
MAKKKNSRKALAVVLGVVGVAGLGIASASQLTVNPTDEVAIGTSAVFAPCDADSTVGIDYGFAATAPYNINSVTITGLDAACAGNNIQFSIANVTTPGSPITGSGTNIVLSSGSWTYTISSPSIPISADLGAATVIVD